MTIYLTMAVIAFIFYSTLCFYLGMRKSIDFWSCLYCAVLWPLAIPYFIFIFILKLLLIRKNNTTRKK